MANYPSLSIQCEYPISEDREDSTIKSSMDGGYVQTRPKFTRIRKIFDIKYKLLPDADKSTLEAFVDTVKGGSDSFVWTHPKTSTTYTVRFDKPPKFDYVEYGYWDTSFKLNQV